MSYGTVATGVLCLGMFAGYMYRAVPEMRKTAIDGYYMNDAKAEVANRLAKPVSPNSVQQPIDKNAQWMRIEATNSLEEIDNQGPSNNPRYPNDYCVTLRFMGTICASDSIKGGPQ